MASNKPSLAGTSYESVDILPKNPRPSPLVPRPLYSTDPAKVEHDKRIAGRQKGRLDGAYESTVPDFLETGAINEGGWPVLPRSTVERRSEVDTAVGAAAARADEARRRAAELQADGRDAPVEPRRSGPRLSPEEIHRIKQAEAKAEFEKTHPPRSVPDLWHTFTGLWR